ncbi:MAG: hypothetical protein KDB61_14910, partial [Planctomycetes bacterium]|nr:hypothetical protein [Planctomycetota bacterium]
MQPEHEDQWERHYEATAAALFFYGLWFGEYPYEAVTVVDPAWGASGAGGMEYPTLFTAGTSRFTSPAMYRPESVTVHEAGHQFWYGLVGNNEYEAAWMDEGFNSYTDSEVLWRHYGPQRSDTRYSSLPVWGVRAAALPSSQGLSGILSGQAWKPSSLPGLGWLPKASLHPADLSPFVAWYRDQPFLTFVDRFTDPRWEDRSSYLRDPDVDPIDTAAFRYRDRNSYRTNSYYRPAVALRSLAGVVGQDAFLRGMRYYADQWRYRHPYPQDFFTAFQAGAQVQIPWYFEELFEGTGTVDWGVTVSDRAIPEGQGWFLGEDGDWHEVSEALTAKNTEEVSSDADTAAEPAEAKDSATAKPDPLRLHGVVVS